MIQADKAYSRAVNVLTFVKKLMNVTRMREQWAQHESNKKEKENVSPRKVCEI
ncbi:hypothetical protein Gotri_014373 [Gossypium trilobum]|uniref:Uncharacterized protein n=1 Tax=Gossypium trilobum TaxID=34281 RepID=A0A7J9DWH9_9ROSI|nr:hypothetical protein [Gossypium trilobum]